MANLNTMSTLKIQCHYCRKKFSGDEEKIVAIKACPKCKHGDDWWTVLERNGPIGAEPKDDDPTPLIPQKPVPVAPAMNLQVSAPVAAQAIQASLSASTSAGTPSTALVLGAVAAALLLIVVTVSITMLVVTDGSATPGVTNGTVAEGSEHIPAEPAKLCTLSGKITWKYNDFVGTKGDVGARLFLFPIDYTEAPASVSALLNQNSGQSGNHKGIMWIRCGGDGQFVIDRIVPGEYTLLVCSNNTNGPLNQDDYFDVKKQEFKRWLAFDGKRDNNELWLLIAQKKYHMQQVNFAAGEAREFHHDFGITWY